MSKYEIVVLISPKLTTDQADQLITDLNKNIKSDSIDSKFLGTRELAYPIENETSAHYYQINFEGEGDCFFDWRRLVLINKTILRHLIVNLSKDYGARALANEKKQKLAANRKAKYHEITTNPDYVHQKPAAQPFVRKKRRDEWTLVARIGAEGPEDITVKKPNPKRNRYSEIPEYKIPSRRNQQQAAEQQQQQHVF